MMQRDVRVMAGQARKHRSCHAGKCRDRIPAKGAEQQVEPHHVWFERPERVQNADRILRVIEGPATLDRETVEFRQLRREFVGKNRYAEKWVAL